LTVSLAGDERNDSSGVTARSVVPDNAAEYRFRPPDLSILTALASATGGSVQPTATTLGGSAADRRLDRRPLWPVLVSAALCLWLVDILLRRVRVFERRG
jgi:hypothetical protein